MNLLEQKSGHAVAGLARRFVVAAMLGLVALPLAAQTGPSDLPDAPQAQSPAKAPQAKSQKFGTNTTYDVAGDRKLVLEPLGPGQKFQIFFKNAYNPFRILAAGFAAGIDQAENYPKGYGQGGEGYAKRFGASMAGAASADYFGSFLLPVLLRQDPRYYRRYETGFGRRLGYALTRVLVTRTDRGGRAFNASQIGGALASSAIANLYYPDSERGMGLTMSRFGYAVGIQAAVNVGCEFWPDIAEKLFHKKQAPLHAGN